VAAFDRHRLEFILGYFDVSSLGDLVSHDNVLGIDLLTGLGIKLAVFDSMSGSFVDLMKWNLLPLRSCREELDRNTRPADKRK